MKKWLVPVLIIGVIIFAGYRWAVGFNNTAVKLNENISESWGNVQTAYQRRGDLIGNLVNTVKGASDFEKSTLTAVINARAKATSVTIDPTNITPQQLANFNKAQGGLSGALKSLLVTVERYPELKANQNFLKLQDELASTENQILTARTRFNEATKPYNTHVKTFPNSILAGLFNFEGKAYFDAEPGSDKAPEVKFDFDKKD
ncbi:MAG: LemA family protein [Flavobacteriales bacterium]|nr:LemA family protein [Flavobacteriales bacterium]